MTTAFVLGGGGVLGAVEVGMLRALFERDVRPDLVLGTSIGAMNGAFVAQEPEPSVVERLLSLWQGAASSGRRDLLGGYRYPAWLLGIGVLAWLLTLYLGYQSLGGLANL